MNDIEGIARDIVNCAITVHKALGPGLLESAYQKFLAYELTEKGLKVQTEILLPIEYKTVQIDAGYRIDMLIENLIIIENKTVERILPIHQAQLLTYLRLRDCRLGFLLNWHTELMRRGIKRMVNNL